MKNHVEKKQEMVVNVVMGTVLFGVIVLIASGIIGCIVSTLLFSGIIGMAYLS